MKKSIVLFLQLLLPFLGFSQALKSVNPSSAFAGQKLNVTITGSATNFTKATTTVAFDFGQASSTTVVNSVNVLSDTVLSANLSVPIATALGKYALTVKNAIDGNLSLPDSFEIKPIVKGNLAGIDPDTVSSGQTLNVTITGVKTHFKQASSCAVNFGFVQGSATTVVSSVNIINDTAIVAKIIVPQTTATGQYDVLVNNELDGELKLTKGIFVNGINPAIWREDFANGVPSSWRQSGVNKIWSHTKKGSSGKYSSNTMMKSSTSLNGAMIYDADADTVATANYTQDISGSITTDPIDLTGHPDVKLNFQSYFRLCCNSEAQLTVSVSTNDTTWTDFDARGDIDINAFSLNPDKKSINISSIAGNKPNVRLKFTFSNAASYFWQIDDISITDAPLNDLHLRRVYVDNGYKNGGYFTKIPHSQVSPISFRGALFNDGANAQTDVKLDVEVSRKATSTATAAVVFKDNSDPKTILRLEEDTLSLANAYTPEEKGLYTATFELKQNEVDEISSNNKIVKNFDVNDSIYARDNGIANADQMYLRIYSSGSEGNALGTLFDIYKPVYPSSISAFINTATALGTSFRYVLYQLTTTEIVEIASSDFYDVAATKNKNKWITLPILNPDKLQLDSNVTYMAAVETYGTTTANAVVISADNTTEQPQAVSLLRIKQNDKNSWGFITGVPLIRLNLSETLKVGIKEQAENAMNLLQNIPNPASKETMIAYELPVAGKVTLKVSDITGKEMIFVNEGDKAAGKHIIKLNTAALASGIYYYTLNDGKTMITKKMVITQ
jgi:hypothetical protein